MKKSRIRIFALSAWRIRGNAHLNKKAIENVIKVGLAVGGKIADFTEFDRKNYFYPTFQKAIRFHNINIQSFRAGVCRAWTSLHTFGRRYYQ